MHLWDLRFAALYFVVQGGKFERANTIYFWPTFSLSQEQKDGFNFGNGKTYHWILSTSFLFWTVGLVW